MGHLSLIQTFPLLLSQSFQQLDSFQLPQTLYNSYSNYFKQNKWFNSFTYDYQSGKWINNSFDEVWEKDWILIKNQILQARFTLLSYLTWMFSWFLFVITKGAGRQWLWSRCRLVGSRRGHVRNDVWSSTILQQGSWSSLWTYPDGTDSGVDV